MKKLVLITLLIAMSACAPGNKGTSVQRMAKGGHGQKGLIAGEVPTQELAKVERDAKGKTTGERCVDLNSLAQSLTKVPNQSFVVTTQLMAVSEVSQFQALAQGEMTDGSDALLGQVLKMAAERKDQSLLPKREVRTMGKILETVPELRIGAQNACDSVGIQAADGTLESYSVVAKSANAISLKSESGTIIRYLLGRSNYEFRIERIWEVSLDHCGQSRNVVMRMATSYLPVDKASQSDKVDVEFLEQLLSLVEGASDYQPPISKTYGKEKKVVSAPLQTKASSMATVRRQDLVNTNQLYLLYDQVEKGLIKTASCQKE